MMRCDLMFGFGSSGDGNGRWSLGAGRWSLGKEGVLFDHLSDALDDSDDLVQQRGSPGLPTRWAGIGFLVRSFADLLEGRLMFRNGLFIFRSTLPCIFRKAAVCLHYIDWLDVFMVTPNG